MKIEVSKGGFSSINPLKNTINGKKKSSFMRILNQNTRHLREIDTPPKKIKFIQSEALTRVFQNTSKFIKESKKITIDNMNRDSFTNHGLVN